MLPLLEILPSSGSFGGGCSLSGGCDCKRSLLYQDVPSETSEELSVSSDASSGKASIFSSHSFAISVFVRLSDMFEDTHRAPVRDILKILGFAHFLIIQKLRSRGGKQGMLNVSATKFYTDAPLLLCKCMALLSEQNVTTLQVLKFLNPWRFLGFRCKKVRVLWGGLGFLNPRGFGV